ncbi:MAG: anhydro-N-acetylmuramic acid kinase [Bacteroidota bacterium]
MEQLYHVIGIMSGTSLDGVDLAYCEFRCNENRWHYAIIEAVTCPYPLGWPEKLRQLETGSALDLAKTHNELGRLYGSMVASFIETHRLKPLFIASHGHTIFHQPGNGFTTQIGDGAAIAAKCGLPVINDFRSMDVALGGQGAPLVPMGDRLLFSDFDYCLNIGGFANISYEKSGKRLAYDVCPANIVLNELAQSSGKAYDNDGNIARQGRIDEKLLNALNGLNYYKISPPKSLGREWLCAEFLPMLHESKRRLEDNMATVVEHIATQIGAAVTGNSNGKLLLTGGGAYNNFLVERIRFHSNAQIIVPDALTVEFKEALIFAFLGVLRWRNENNGLSSVTGARADSCGGAVYSGNR